MLLGVGFPHAEIGTDPAAIAAYAQRAEEAGLDFLALPEHVAGSHADRFIGVDTGYPSPPYFYDHPFHEPFTLIAFLAGMTSRIEFAIAVLVLPQRQTVLVAKQAAEVMLLSRGRLRLGVGVGWNHPEFEALGAEFHTRGAREAEQIELLRRLWSEPLLSFSGRWHTLDRVGISPLPERPIPIWMGGGVGEATLRRTARLADGWIPNLPPDGDNVALVAKMHRYLEEAGREPSSLGIQIRLDPAATPAEWVNVARRWAALGATHLWVPSSTRGSRLSATQHLDRGIEMKRVLALELGW